MMMIPIRKDDREMAIDCFLADMAQGRLSSFDAGDMLAQLRLAGDVANLERLSRLLSTRGA